MLVAIPVLEEALGVKALLSDDVGETVEDALDAGLLSTGGSGTAVVALSPGVINGHVEVLLEAFLDEDLVDLVTEVSPADVVTSLGSFESVAK